MTITRCDRVVFSYSLFDILQMLSFWQMKFRCDHILESKCRGVVVTWPLSTKGLYRDFRCMISASLWIDSSLIMSMYCILRSSNYGSKQQHFQGHKQFKKKNFPQLFFFQFFQFNKTHTHTHTYIYMLFYAQYIKPCCCKMYSF